MDGRDSWLDHSNPLNAEQYSVRILMKGNDDVEQQFEYAIKHNVAGLSIVEH